MVLGRMCRRRLYMLHHYDLFTVYRRLLYKRIGTQCTFSGIVPPGPRKPEKM